MPIFRKLRTVWTKVKGWAPGIPRGLPLPRMKSPAFPSSRGASPRPLALHSLLRTSIFLKAATPAVTRTVVTTSAKPIAVISHAECVSVSSRVHYQHQNRKMSGFSRSNGPRPPGGLAGRREPCGLADRLAIACRLWRWRIAMCAGMYAGSRSKICATGAPPINRERSDHIAEDKARCAVPGGTAAGDQAGNVSSSCWSCARLRALDHATCLVVLPSPMRPVARWRA